MSRRQYLIQQETDRIRNNLIQYGHLPPEKSAWQQADKAVVDSLIFGAMLIDGEPCMMACGVARKIRWKKIGPSVYSVSLGEVVQ